MSPITTFRAEGVKLELVPLDASSLDESTLRTAHGVYTVMRLFEGRRTFRLSRHWKRLRASARLLNMMFTHSDEWLQSTLRNVIQQLPFESARVRLTIPFNAPGTAVISCESFIPPPESIYQDGVKVELVNGRRDVPLAKNSRFIEWRQDASVLLPKDTYEFLLVSDGEEINEGASSNFYIKIDGKLRTPDVGMLEGIARGVLLEVAPSILPVEVAPIFRHDLDRATEAMLTSASRSVVPVINVGGTSIGIGAPGESARMLRRAFDEQVLRELEPI